MVESKITLVPEIHEKKTYPGTFLLLMYATVILVDAKQRARRLRVWFGGLVIHGLVGFLEPLM